MKIKCIRTNLTDEEYKKTIEYKTGTGSHSFAAFVFPGIEYEVFGIRTPHDLSSRLPEYLIETSVVDKNKVISNNGLVFYVPQCLFEIVVPTFAEGLFEFENSYNEDYPKDSLIFIAKELLNDPYFICNYSEDSPEAIEKFQRLKIKLIDPTSTAESKNGM